MKRKVRLTHTVEMYVEGESEEVIQDWLNRTTPVEAKSLSKNATEEYSEEIVCPVREDSHVDFVIEEGKSRITDKGKSVNMPVAVGDVVYRVNKGAAEPIIEMKVILIHQTEKCIKFGTKDIADGNECFYDSSDVGKIVFLTTSDARLTLEKSTELEIKYYVYGTNSMGSTWYLGGKDATSCTLWDGAPEEMRAVYETKEEALEKVKELDEAYKFGTTRHYIQPFRAKEIEKPSEMEAEQLAPMKRRVK